MGQMDEQQGWILSFSVGRQVKDELIVDYHLGGLKKRFGGWRSFSPNAEQYCTWSKSPS